MDSVIQRFRFDDPVDHHADTFSVLSFTRLFEFRIAPLRIGAILLTQRSILS